MRCPTCNQELSQPSVADKACMLETLVVIAERIRDSGAVWETVFDLVFSPNLSCRINSLMKELGIDASYYNPDTTYEEDVRAYISDRRARVDELMKALGCE